LIALAPDVILAPGSFTMGPLLQATRTVPIVFVHVPDPVGAGFVESLARPGGNATGFILRPSLQPNRCRLCWNAATRACASGSSSAWPMSTPIRRTRSGCCARAGSGQIAAVPPISVMNSRRLMPIMGFDPSRALPGVRHDSSNRAALARGLPHQPASGRSGAGPEPN
jgi:hypothetical protein